MTTLSFREEFIRTTKKYLGTPWTHCGRSKAGLDCVGLYWIVLKDLNHSLANDLHEMNIYERIPQGTQLIDEIAKRMKRKAKSQVLPGDLMVLRVRSLITHVGIYDYDVQLNRPMIIHADNTRGVIRHGLGYWDSRIEAIFEIPNV